MILLNLGERTEKDAINFSAKVHVLRFVPHRTRHVVRQRSHDISVATFIHIFNRRHRCSILWPLFLALLFPFPLSLSLSSENPRGRAFTARRWSIIHTHGNHETLAANKTSIFDHGSSSNSNDRRRFCKYYACTCTDVSCNALRNIYERRGGNILRDLRHIEASSRNKCFVNVSQRFVSRSPGFLLVGSFFLANETTFETRHSSLSRSTMMVCYDVGNYLLVPQRSRLSIVGKVHVQRYVCWFRIVRNIICQKFVRSWRFRFCLRVPFPRSERKRYE